MHKALITGAAGSLGQAVTKAFSPHCSKLVLCARDKEFKQTFDNCQNHVEVVTGDLTKGGTAQKIVYRAIENDVDMLVCCAGYYQLYDAHQPSRDIQGVIDTNLVSTIKLITYITEQHFFKRGNGTIVIVNSQAGKHGNATEAVYCASKFGLRGFAESVTQWYMMKGVKLLSVYPGAFKSKITKNREHFNKLMEPDDIAQVIADLCFKHESVRLTDVDILRTNY